MFRVHGLPAIQTENNHDIGYHNEVFEADIDVVIKFIKLEEARIKQ